MANNLVIIVSNLNLKHMELNETTSIYTSQFVYILLALTIIIWHEIFRSGMAFYHVLVDVAVANTMNTCLDFVDGGGDHNDNKRTHCCCCPSVVKPALWLSISFQFSSWHICLFRQ